MWTQIGLFITAFFGSLLLTYGLIRHEGTLILFGAVIVGGILLHWAFCMVSLFREKKNVFRVEALDGPVENSPCCGNHNPGVCSCPTCDCLKDKNP